MASVAGSTRCRTRSAPSRVKLARLVGLSTDCAAILHAIDSIDIEDDGSPEWGYVTGVFTMVGCCLRGRDTEECLRDAICTVLDGTLNDLANEVALAQGRPTTQAEAELAIAGDPRWRSVVAFVEAL